MQKHVKFSVLEPPYVAVYSTYIHLMCPTFLSDFNQT